MLVHLGKGRFILDTEEDVCARAAIDAYADACKMYNPNTEEIVRRQIHGESDAYLCIETALRILASAHSTGSRLDGYSKQAWDQVTATLLSLSPGANRRQ